MVNSIEIFDYLHDTGMSNFAFDFDNRKLAIDFLFWDDIKQEEVVLTITLLGVTKFISEYPEDMEFNPEGCNNAVCKKITDKKYEVEFAFELWQGQVVWEVIIDFETLTVTGGLSEEALKYKYEELAV